MRVIEFRGLSLEPLVQESDWLYGNLTINYEEELAYINDMPVHFKSVGQFVGIADKEKKRIYENDILVLTDYHGQRRVSVMYARSMSVFMYGDGQYSDEYLFNSSDRLVIGNTIEHPELMETETLKRKDEDKC